MPLGPGRYDDICTEVREKTGGKSVIIIIFDGDKGTGFSCQVDLIILSKIPEILESLARDIRQSINEPIPPESMILIP